MILNVKVFSNFGINIFIFHILLKSIRNLSTFISGIHFSIYWLINWPVGLQWRHRPIKSQSFFGFYRTQVRSLPCLVSPSVLLVNFLQIGFVLVVSWISLSCSVDLSKLMYWFLLFVTWICQNWDMGFSKLLHSLGFYMGLSKLLHMDSLKNQYKTIQRGWKGTALCLTENIFPSEKRFLQNFIEKCEKTQLQSYWEIFLRNWQYLWSRFWSVPYILWKIPKNTENIEK